MVYLVGQRGQYRLFHRAHHVHQARLSFRLWALKIINDEFIIQRDFSNTFKRSIKRLVFLNRLYYLQ